jgi:hypothetical protein
MGTIVPALPGGDAPGVGLAGDEGKNEEKAEQDGHPLLDAVVAPFHAT